MIQFEQVKNLLLALNQTTKQKNKERSQIA